MAANNRLNGKPYTCANRRFETCVDDGFAHREGTSRGSVFPFPLVDSEHSLWLEHVIDNEENNRVYWLMWYDRAGNPTIPVSSVLSAADVRNMASQLACFIELP